MGEVVETLEGHRRSVAAPLVFILVVVLQFVSRWLLQLKKRGVKTATANRLHGEIKDLLKEASSLSQPSTFAQAAKLRRIAAAKEKELANYQELHGKERKLSYELYLKVLFISKVLTYLVLIWWFWRVPVASISQQLVQPFGKVLSWKAGGILNENFMGIFKGKLYKSNLNKELKRLSPGKPVYRSCNATVIFNEKDKPFYPVWLLEWRV